jgi:hypothetical protein
MRLAVHADDYNGCSHFRNTIRIGSDRIGTSRPNSNFCVCFRSRVARDGLSSSPYPEELTEGIPGVRSFATRKTPNWY